MYDDDDAGTISKHNLMNVAKELQQVVSEKELDLMLVMGDREKRYGGEEVDIDDFMRIMLKAKLYKENDEDSYPAHPAFDLITPQSKSGYGAAVAGSDQKFNEMGLEMGLV